MAADTAITALQRFVDDELLRAPMVLEAAIKSIFEALQRLPPGSSASERQLTADVILRLGSHRPRVVDRYVASLRDQALRELARGTPQPEEKEAQAKPMLALLDNSEVAVDVTLSQTIEAIRSVAEHEMRELLAYTSALVGDMDVTSDHNPLRADTQARALWAAAQALPLSRAHQLAFVRHATMPFAQALRKSYAAACSRLEAEGVEPAVYRTVVAPGGPRAARAMPGTTMMPDATAGRASPFVTVPRRAGDSRADRLARDVIDQIGRVFAAMLADRRLPIELHALVSRMQSCAVQAAAVDPALLDHPEHPLWRFMDLVVHMAVLDSGEEGRARDALLQFVERLIDPLNGEPRHTPQLYQWVLERLERFAANRLTTRITAAEHHVQTMQELERRMAGNAPPSTLHGTLDASHLDTVPADLLDAPPTRTGGTDQDIDRWLLDRNPGDWMRMFTKGGWVWTQLLWIGDRGELWLFGDGDSDESWAIRRSALKVLREAGLAEVLHPRSLLRAAMQRLARGGAH